MKKLTVRRTVYLGLCLSIALIFSYVEFLIPIPFPVPGIKLGLANGVILLAMFLFNPLEAFVVGLLRVILSALLFGSLFSFVFSMAGFLISFFMMYSVKKAGKCSMLGISICGGVFHNVAQIFIAVYITKISAVLYYLPVLTVCGIITGLLNGYLSKEIYKRVKKYDSLR